MFFGKQNAGIKCVGKMALFIFLPLLISIMSYSSAKGSIAIFENPNGIGFTIEFRKFSARNKCELPLKKNDEIQIEISREDGEIAMTISGKNGSEPYTGNHLQPGIFTVAVSETDEYVFTITGHKATGKVIVKNLGSWQSMKD